MKRVTWKIFIKTLIRILPVIATILGLNSSM